MARSSSSGGSSSSGSEPELELRFPRQAADAQSAPGSESSGSGSSSGQNRRLSRTSRPRSGMIFSDSDSDDDRAAARPPPAAPRADRGLLRPAPACPGAGDYAEAAAAKFAEETRPCPFSPAELDFLRLAREKNIAGPLWRGSLKWHNAHLHFRVREDPRTYSTAVATRYQAEDKHQHEAIHTHTTQLALVPRTTTPFTDPIWLIQDILLDTGLLGNMDLLPQLRRNDPFGPLNKVL